MAYLKEPGIYLSKVKGEDGVLFLSFRLWLNSYGSALSNLMSAPSRKTINGSVLAGRLTQKNINFRGVLWPCL
jgi:hypothetical protein